MRTVLASVALVLLVVGRDATPGSAQVAPAARAQAGRAAYERRCARCHGADGAGGEHGPDILHSTTARTLSQKGLEDLLRAGVPAAGMPAFVMPAAELQALTGYVRALIAPAHSGRRFIR